MLIRTRQRRKNDSSRSNTLKIMVDQDQLSRVVELG